MTVALHIRRAFTPQQEVTSYSPFRPPPSPTPGLFALHVSRVGSSESIGPASLRGLRRSALPFTPSQPSDSVDRAVETSNPLRLRFTITSDAVRVYAPCEMERASSCHSAVPGRAVIDLCHRLRPQDSDARGGLFTGKSEKRHPERHLHQKVMSILSRVTPQKYLELRKELLELPIRQADEEQLGRIATIFFEKAVHEEKFCALYANMIQSIFLAAQEEASSSSQTNAPSFTPNFAGKTTELARKLCKALLDHCQREFEKPFHLTLDDMIQSDGAAVDSQRIAALRLTIKKRLCGNVRFVGELYNHNIVSDRLIQSIAHRILEAVRGHEKLSIRNGADDDTSADDMMEAFVVLVTSTGRRARETNPKFINFCLSVAQQHSKSATAKLSTRVKFLLMNLLDLAAAGWPSSEPESVDSPSSHYIAQTVVKSPNTADTSVASTARTSSTGRGLPPRHSTSSVDTEPTVREAPLKNSPTVLEPSPSKQLGKDEHSDALIQLSHAFPEVEKLLVLLLEPHSDMSPRAALMDVLRRATMISKLGELRAAVPRLIHSLCLLSPPVKSEGNHNDPFTTHAVEQVIADTIESSVIDGLHDDCPLLFDHWLAIATHASHDEAQFALSRVCGSGVVVPSLFRAVARGASQGVIEPDSDVYDRIAAGLRKHPSCLSEARRLLEKENDSLEPAVITRLQLALEPPHS